MSSTTNNDRPNPSTKLSLLSATFAQRERTVSSNQEPNAVLGQTRISRISRALMDNGDDDLSVASSEPPTSIMDIVLPGEERHGTSLGTTSTRPSRRVSPDDSPVGMSGQHAMSLGAMEREYDKDTWRMYELIHNARKLHPALSRKAATGGVGTASEMGEAHAEISESHHTETSLEEGIFELDLGC